MNTLAHYRQQGRSSCGGVASTSRPLQVARLAALPRLNTRIACESGNTATADASPQSVKLSFKLPYRCSFGEEVCMVGSTQEMGGWDVESGVSMKWTEGDEWTVDLELKAGPDLDLEYKYVVRNHETGEVVCWKPGTNYQIKVPILYEEERAIAEGVRVRDAWDGSIQDIQVEVTNLGSSQWTAEQELQAMESALNRALGDLRDVVGSSQDLADTAYDPASPELLQADRVVAAAARKAMAMSRALKAATSYTEQVLPGMGGQEPPQLPGGMHY